MVGNRRHTPVEAEFGQTFLSDFGETEFGYFLTKSEKQEKSKKTLKKPKKSELEKIEKLTRITRVGQTKRLCFFGVKVSSRRPVTFHKNTAYARLGVRVFGCLGFRVKGLDCFFKKNLLVSDANPEDWLALQILV